MAESVTIKCTARDSGGLTGMATKTIMVIEPDTVPPIPDAPQIISLSAEVNPIAPDNTTTLTVVGINYNNVVWTGVGVMSTSTPEMIDFTAPDNVVAGTTYTITVRLENTVTDQFDTDSLTMTIRNVAPEITSLDLPISITVGSSFEGFVIAEDNNGDNLRYVWLSRGFTQGIAEGSPAHGRAFQAPNSITSAADATKTIIATVHDIPPSPYTSDRDSDSRVVIVEPNAPRPPIIRSLDPESTQITANWAPHMNTGGGPITGYRVWIRRLAVSTEDSDQAWSISRSTVVSAGIRQFIFASPSYSLIPGTPYEIGVEAFNTFDINGESYGGRSDRGVDTITTTSGFVPPVDPPPEENFAPIVEIDTTGYDTSFGPGFIVITKTMLVQTFDFSGTYSDADGDELTVYWTLNPGNSGALLNADPILDPYQGTATCTLVLGADAEDGTAALTLSAYDNVTNDQDDPSEDVIFIFIDVT